MRIVLIMRVFIMRGHSIYYWYVPLKRALEKINKKVISLNLNSPGGLFLGWSLPLSWIVSPANHHLIKYSYIFTKVSETSEKPIILKNFIIKKEIILRFSLDLCLNRLSSNWIIGSGTSVWKLPEKSCIIFGVDFWDFSALVMISVKCFVRCCASGENVAKTQIPFW